MPYAGCRAFAARNQAIAQRHRAVFDQTGSERRSRPTIESDTNPPSSAPPAGWIHRPCTRQQRQRNSRRLRNAPPQPLRHRRNRPEVHRLTLRKPRPQRRRSAGFPVDLRGVEHRDVAISQRRQGVYATGQTRHRRNAQSRDNQLASASHSSPSHRFKKRVTVSERPSRNTLKR